MDNGLESRDHVLLLPPHGRLKAYHLTTAIALHLTFHLRQSSYASIIRESLSSFTFTPNLIRHIRVRKRIYISSSHIDHVVMTR